MPIMTCPPADRLIAFQIGKLNHHDLNEVALHVESCGACLTVLERESTMNDTLVKELRHARDHDDFAAESDCQRAVAHAAALLGSAAHSPEGTIDFVPGDDSPITLGKYQLLEKIGQGGMGTVYKAFHTLLKRVVALKLLPPNRLQDTQAVSRFRREIEAAGRLDHPHIVRTSDADTADGRHFLVMEWLAGQDIAKYVRERGPLRIEQACDFIRQAALGLACAHQHGMVHRDVKPSNLLVTENADGTSQVKVLDLGLALLQVNDPACEELTGANRMMGTYDYLAPEQAVNAHEVDSRADIYSLGCTFYYLLTARAPFQGRSEAQKLLAHQRDEPSPISQFRTDAPHDVVAVLNRMTAKDPAHRFASMNDVADSIQKTDTRINAQMLDTVLAQTKRRRKLIFAAAVVGLVLLIGGVLLFPQIVIRIKGKDGVTELKLPKGVGVDMFKDGKKIASIPGDGKPAKDDTKKPSSGAKVTGEIKKNPDKLLAAGGQHSDAVTQLAVSRDGTRLLTYTSDKVLWFWEWDARTKTLRQRWKKKQDQLGIQSISLDPSGSQALFSGGFSSPLGSTPLLTRLDTETEQMQLIRPGLDRCGTVAISPDGRRYVVGDPEGFSIFEFPKVLDKSAGRFGPAGESLRKFTSNFLVGADKYPVQQICFSSDGERILSSGADHTVRLWNSTNAEELKKLSFPAATKRFIALSPDGKQALISQGNDVQVWDLNTGKSLAVLKGHKDHVTAVAYGPNGSWAVSASRDKTLRVWDVAVGKELAKLEGHTDDVTCLAVTAQGRLILSGSRDKTLRVWAWPK